MRKPLLVGIGGCGSVIVEFAFNLAGIAYDYERWTIPTTARRARGCWK
jgi:hypothetical protein